MDSKFTSSHSLTQLKAVFIVIQKSFGFGLVISILVSSVNNIGVVVLLIVLGRSFM